MEKLCENCNISSKNIITKTSDKNNNKTKKMDSFFNCFERGSVINISNFGAQKFLKALGNSLLCLSSSPVWNARLCVGGIYHKNYYNRLKKGIFEPKSTVFFEKNVKLCDFGKFIKQHLCNYGVWFFEKDGNIFVKIFCGNGHLLEQTQQNFVCKKIAEFLQKKQF